MASADPLIASSCSVSTAKFTVNVSQLRNMIKNKVTVLHIIKKNQKNTRGSELIS